MDAAEEAKLLANFWNVLDAEIFFQNRERKMGDYGFRSLVRPYVRQAKPQAVIISPEPIAEVHVAANLQKIDEIATIKPERSNMSILGLESGTFQAKLAEIRKRAADGRAAGLSKMDGAVTAGLAKIDAAADVVIAKVDKEVEAQIGEFAAFGDNGGESS